MVEIGAEVFEPLAHESHFPSYRSKRSEVAEVTVFCRWLLGEAGAGA